jgi:hypothetical protein
VPKRKAPALKSAGALISRDYSVLILLNVYIE